MRKAITILDKIKKNNKLNELYNKINPILFDVSLRDGIQTMNSMDSKDKMIIFNKIINNMEPNKIEVGSLVTNKVLPIMSDTPEIYQECIRNVNYINHDKMFTELKEMNIPDIYVLIPATERRVKQAEKLHMNNISIMSSVSESFMMKNARMSINDVKEGLVKIKWASNIKLYLSCINECPIEGEINKNIIIDEIVHFAKNYKNYKLNEICLSDTCGTLTFNDYKYILDGCIEENVPMDLLSLHLHVGNNNEVEKIIRYSLLNKMNAFDVSALDEGGCIVTINNPKKNLNYDTFYEILLKYMLDLLIDGPHGPSGKAFLLIKENKNKNNIIDKKVFNYK